MNIVTACENLSNRMTWFIGLHASAMLNVNVLHSLVSCVLEKSHSPFLYLW